MDALARVGPVARPLLDRVDAILADLGAPPDHEVWAALRRLGATPGQAAAFIDGLNPEPLWAAASMLHRRASRCGELVVGEPVGWSGPAGERFAAVVRTLDAQLNPDSPDTVVGRIIATASFVDDVARWCVDARSRLARTLAEVLVCAQTVTVWSHPNGTLVGSRQRADGAAVARAAADIAWHVLDDVGVSWLEGERLVRRWDSRIAGLVVRDDRAEAGGTHHGDLLTAVTRIDL